MGKFEVHRYKGKFEVRELEKKYTLFVVNRDVKPEDLEHTHFQIPSLEGAFPLKEYPKMPVTGRSWIDYPQGVTRLGIYPGMQIIEVGAGNGGFIPIVVRMTRGCEPRPIVIDPVNYGLMREMIEEALGVDGLHHRAAATLEELRRRNLIITDEKKVNLINMKFGDAIAAHPELIGSADVVVDSAGARWYAESEIRIEDLGFEDIEQRARTRVQTLEKSLLKSGGKYLY